MAAGSKAAEEQDNDECASGGDMDSISDMDDAAAEICPRNRISIAENAEDAEIDNQA